jgi:hypothetical protein
MIAAMLPKKRLRFDIKPSLKNIPPDQILRVPRRGNTPGVLKRGLTLVIGCLNGLKLL